ncbi:hypothetical protein CgunFtcFv8_026319 [Champsocephalus gunnari]|uniref:Uncharacterized protein n=1 Tax=Champsocephalus gunnari TaxID=52237 RepID=A0AAN8CCP6_CHAGU|nr:hypothetical protein CgunFtcFv8_026319 [Champsocephalus gunnari]
MLWFSQDSVMIVTQWGAHLTLISSILLIRDLVLARNRLGSAGLYGLAFSLALSPARLPRFCLLSFRRWRHLAGGTVKPIASGLRRVSGGMKVVSNVR